MSNIQHVTVLGTGVLGSQIAYQAAFAGKTVTAYDINDDAVAAGRERAAGLAKRYEAEVDGAAGGKAQAALESMTFTADLAEAVKNADLVIEAVPEKIEIKRGTYEKLSAVAPEKTIFATNSSTLLPSDIVDATDRPEKFLALHFANEIWKHNTAEVMPVPATSEDTKREVEEYAAEMGMVPIVLKKEKAGYLLNSLLVPWLDAAAGLWAGDFADPETIDKTWKLATGAPLGPFQVFDVVGLTTAYNITSSNPDPAHQAVAAKLKEKIDAGELGRATGKGFYTYDA
ncbi:3-hydroxyacyl-CoA dehydrogenase [Galactobacter valiniphilus]|uniref:3-hydroxyacyl-CoA dehydrogenase n=1 Tax=Galactobacter valiniphilus TaxID=2676122 RepID=UPI003735E346